ncbi:MAG: peptidylprolyl isomerase [Fidelibacterota bacterium]
MHFKFLSCIVFSTLLYSQQNQNGQTIDGIAAIVSDNIVLKSDVNQLLGMTVLQRGLDARTDKTEVEKLRNEILQSMIDRKVILEMAKLDSVEISDKDVDRELDNYINNMIGQAGSEDAAEKAIGKPIRIFRREYWSDMQELLIGQKYQQQLLINISVNRDEVISFFNTYKDSIPPFPTMVKLRHILLKVEPSQKQIDKTISILKELKKRILAGESFETLAEEYSQDPGSKNSGGNLGYVRRGNLVPEFEAVAFTLDPGQISDPVKTEFGYHLIETQEILGDKIKVRHILVSPKITREDESRTYYFASSLKDSSSTLDSFIKMARTYSHDEQTRNTGGLIGWIDPSQYPIQEIGTAIKQIKKMECSGPVRSSLGYHLLWIEEVRPGGKPDIDKNWIEIEEMALNRAKAKWFENWLDDSRKKFYINKLY